MKLWFRVTLVIGAIATVVACGGPAASGPSAPTAPMVDEATATAMAENAFAALNSGDYDAWIRNWSQDMKGMIKKQDFHSFREQVLAAKGRFVSIHGVTFGSVKAGTYRYTFDLAFEKGTARIALAFFDGSTAIDGVHYE